jgi:hypothetical protein
MSAYDFGHAGSLLHGYHCHGGGDGFHNRSPLAPRPSRPRGSARMALQPFRSLAQHEQLRRILPAARVVGSSRRIDVAHPRQHLKEVAGRR